MVDFFLLPAVALERSNLERQVLHNSVRLI
jgi:hypothetical protein